MTKGKLPEADIAFLDEVFKANSAILNSLLTILNERLFHQGSVAAPVPLESLFAASNELPEEDELAALYDRFLIRFTIGYIEAPDRFEALLRLEAPTQVTTLERGDLATLQRFVDSVKIGDGIIQDIIELRRLLREDNVVASDRRYRQSLSVLKAGAFVEGRASVSVEDLRWLEHVLWSDPEEVPKVRAALAQIATGFEEEARTLVEKAREVAAFAKRPWPDMNAQSRAALEAHTKLEEMQKRVETMCETGQSRGRDVNLLLKMRDEIVSLQAGLFSVRN